MFVDLLKVKRQPTFPTLLEALALGALLEVVRIEVRYLHYRLAVLAFGKIYAVPEAVQVV